MGSTARLFVCHGPTGLSEQLHQRLAELEARWSRFVESSEVSAMNAGAGTPVAVSTDTLLLVRRALSASRLTRGLFDPTLLDELTRAGYDRSFSELAHHGLGDLVITVDHASGGVQLHDWTAVCRSMVVDDNAGTVTVPAGVGFDPGGLGKGLAADLLAAQAIDAGVSAVLVDLGGDIVTAGQAPEHGWPVDVEDPFDRDRVAFSLRLPWGAVATSSRSRRRWIHEGREQHHLIDPGTGAPAASDAAAATVVAGACWLAEAYAKAAVIAGTEVGLDLLARGGVEGVVVDHAGRHHLTDGMAELVR